MTTSDAHSASASPLAAGYLAAYTAQVRGRVPLGTTRGWTRVGPVIRDEGSTGQGHIGYRDLGGLDGARLDAFIAAQRDHFAERGMAVEWKLHDDDLPADLPRRLTAAGFVAGAPEAILIGAAADLAAAPVLPAGVRLREVTERTDLERFHAFFRRIWGLDLPGLPAMLEREINGTVDRTVVVVAEAGDTIVSASWLRLLAGTDFATMWGGGTLPEWRGKGIYRATVAHRADVAVRNGFRLLQVDTSPDSRPILRRLGLLPVTATTPYQWSPGSDSGRPV